MHQRVGAAHPGCKRHKKEKECSRPATQTKFSPGCLATNCLSWPTRLATFQHCDTPHTSFIFPQNHEEDPETCHILPQQALFMLSFCPQLWKNCSVTSRRKPLFFLFFAPFAQAAVRVVLESRNRSVLRQRGDTYG